MEIGTLLEQRYRVKEKLGEGGMGVVFKAHDILLDRPVAIKALSPHLLGDEGVKRFLREAQSAAKLTHPNIVAIYDLVEDGNVRLIVMEYVAGRILRTLIPLPPVEAAEMASQICLALDYAHAHGVVHRDIKPENIIIAANGIAKVMDFGLAHSEGRSRLTQTGLIVGTVAYMAPEQALSGRVDGRSDLYSLGAVLFETITGKRPFEADDPMSVISMHVNVPPLSPRFYRPEIPAVLESVILRLLAKDPTERYASADEVGRVLKAAFTPDKAQESAVAPPTETRPAAVSLFEMMTRGRLIDREEELATLKSALESMLSASGQFVLIAGEPGIGKTRLAEELLVYARLRGSLALVGHCYEQEANIPYLPFAEMVRAAVSATPESRLTEVVEPFAPELVKLVPELSRAITGLTLSLPLEPDQERLRLLNSVTGFLTELAARQPVVLMLDDLHWADTGTLQLLRHLARSIRTKRVLLLGTYREAELDRTRPLSAILSEMNRERLYMRVLVRGLTPPHVAVMIQSILQLKQPVSAGFRDLIYTETEGNPFFVEEVLKHLVEVGALFLEDGQWHPKPLQEMDVPQSVREVIHRRLERVSEPCQRALSLAAVIGRRFRFEVLQAVGELREEELLDALEEAIAAQLIREERGAAEVEEYDFVHALIREVLYERLSLRRRRMLHQRAGEALERLYANRLEGVVEDLAHHFTRALQGEGLSKAIRYSLDAARKSMNLFAHEEAIQYYQNAAELLEETGDERRLAETHIAIGQAFTYLGDTAAAVDAYNQAMTFYTSRGTPVDAARVHRLIGHALQRDWNFAEAIPHLERALQDFSPDNHVLDVIQSHADLARANFFTDRTIEAKEHGEQALALAKDNGVLTAQVDVHATLGLIANTRADLDAAMDHFGEGIKLAKEAADPATYHGLMRNLHNMAQVYNQRGEHTEALRLLHEGLEIGRRARSVEQMSFYNRRLSEAYFFLGDSASARRHIMDNLRLQLSPTRLQESEYMLTLLDRRLEEAAALAHVIAADHWRRGDFPWARYFSAMETWHNLELDRIEEARAAAAEALGKAIPPGWTELMWFIVEALARGGDDEQCKVLCDKVELFGRATNNPQLLAGALAGRALLDVEKGDLHRGITLLEESLPLTKSLPVLHAHALHTLARVLTRRAGRGDAERVRTLLQECLNLLGRMGDTRKVERVRTEFISLI